MATQEADVRDKRKNEGLIEFLKENNPIEGTVIIVSSSTVDVVDPVNKHPHVLVSPGNGNVLPHEPIYDGEAKKVLDTCRRAGYDVELHPGYQESSNPNT